jgi:hypothetical protein
MNELHAEKLAGVLVLLKQLSGGSECVKDFISPSMPVEPDNIARFYAVLRDAESLFKDIGLDKSLTQVSLVKGALDYSLGLTVSENAVEIRRILETIITELSERKFLFVAADRQEFYENDALFGPEVIRKFPLAKEDIVAAGNCLCAECHTAAVFHLMLAFEWALRTFCSDLGLKRMKDWDKKKNCFKYVPASFAIWEKILTQLPGKIERRLRGLRSGPRKQQLQEYYKTSLDDIDRVRDAWRNHVMHTRRTFNRDDSCAVFGRVKDMMERLADDKKNRAI